MTEQAHSKPKNHRGPGRQPRINIASQYGSNDSSFKDEKLGKKLFTMAARGEKEAELHFQAGKCCEFTDRKITAELLHEFAKKQENFFKYKELKDSDDVKVQTKRSFAAFAANRKADKYIDNHKPRLAKLSFPDFLKEMWKYLLEKDWSKTALTELMNVRMKSGDSFETHSNDMVYRNRLLEGTEQHQDNDKLCVIMTSSLPSFLHTHAFAIVAVNYDSWANQLMECIKGDSDLSVHLAAASGNFMAAATIQNANTRVKHTESQQTSGLLPAYQSGQNTEYFTQNQNQNQF
ncbi:hypothetical protein C8J56DRAFT_1058442 [Mycena floridula]|nr:hypothetical protein C8J56DRAFT_1058442 [Mycena floridula]